MLSAKVIIFMSLDKNYVMMIFLFVHDLFFLSKGEKKFSWNKQHFGEVLCSNKIDGSKGNNPVVQYVVKDKYTLD